MQLAEVTNIQAVETGAIGEDGEVHGEVVAAVAVEVHERCLYACFGGTEKLWI